MRLCSAAPGAQKIHKNTHDHENTVREPRWTPRESSAMALQCPSSPRIWTAHRAPWICLDRRCGKPGPRETEEARCAGHAGMPTDASPGPQMPRGRTAHSCRKAMCCSTPKAGLPRVVLIAGRTTLQRRAAHRAFTATWIAEASAYPPGCPAPRTGTLDCTPIENEP